MHHTRMYTRAVLLHAMHGHVWRVRALCRVCYYCMMAAARVCDVEHCV